MNSLQTQIDSLTATFVNALIGALRGMAIGDLGALSADSPAPTRSPRPASPASRKSSAGGRLARRSPEEITKQISRIVTLLATAPGGLRAEEIKSALRIDDREWNRPIAEALDLGEVQKSGVKRSTVYQLAKSAAKKSPAKKPTAKKSPAKAAKKPTAKKSPAKAAKKLTAKKSPAKKSPAKKPTAKKSPAKKSPAKAAKSPAAESTAPAPEA